MIAARPFPKAIWALTIWEPWASLIMIGAKPYEFRGWHRAWLAGERIGIHAGARPVKRDEVAELILRLKSDEDWSTCLRKEIALPFLEKVHGSPRSLPLAHMLGTALVGKAVLGPSVVSEFGGPENAFGNDSNRDEDANWAWPLSNIKPLQPPVPAKGAQGLWRWHGALAA